MQTLKQHSPKTTATHYLILYVFALVVVFFGFTDLPRMRDQAFPLFCLFIALLAIPVLVDAHRNRPRA
jgi:uncharacterized membrane protein YkvI